MNTPAELTRPDKAGVYRFEGALGDLLENAGRNGFAVFEAKLPQAADKDGILAAFAQAIHAPDWFGHNWDALADSLCDLSWSPAPGYVLLLRGNLPAGQELPDILEAAVQYWKTQGKPFWVFHL